MIGVKSRYFQWLCGLVLADDPDHSYMKLLTVLHSLPFVWHIDKDENRAKDGLAFRKEYGVRDDNEPCTFLEMMIGICHRMEFIAGCDLAFWFWELIGNLGLEGLEDEWFESLDGRKLTIEAVKKVNERLYRPNGEGGLFPLQKRGVDQRKIELWYQMQSYLDENYEIS